MTVAMAWDLESCLESSWELIVNIGYYYIAQIIKNKRTEALALEIPQHWPQSWHVEKFTGFLLFAKCHLWNHKNWSGDKVPTQATNKNVRIKELMLIIVGPAISLTWTINYTNSMFINPMLWEPSRRSETWRTSFEQLSRLRLLGQNEITGWGRGSDFGKIIPHRKDQQNAWFIFWSLIRMLLNLAKRWIGEMWAVLDEASQDGHLVYFPGLNCLSRDSPKPSFVAAWNNCPRGKQRQQPQKSGESTVRGRGMMAFEREIPLLDKGSLPPTTWMKPLDPRNRHLPR